MKCTETSDEAVCEAETETVTVTDCTTHQDTGRRQGETERDPGKTPRPCPLPEAPGLTGDFLNGTLLSNAAGRGAGGSWLPETQSPTRKLDKPLEEPQKAEGRKDDNE